MSNQGLPTHPDTAPLPLKPPPAETPSLTLLLASTYCCCCCLCSLPPLPCPSGVISLLCAKNLVSECVLYGLKGAHLPYNTFKDFGSLPKMDFSVPYGHMLTCFLLLFCIECGSEAVWALRTLRYSSGEAGFSLSCPVLSWPGLLWDWGLGSVPVLSCQEGGGEWICNLWLVPMPYSEFLYSKIFVGSHESALD